MTESFREIQATSAPEGQEGKLTFAEKLSQAAATTDGPKITTPYLDNTLPHLHIDDSQSLTQFSSLPWVGVGVESAAIGMWSGRTVSLEESGKPLISLKLSDGLHGTMRGLLGTLGVNIVDDVLSEQYNMPLLKPSLPETFAMGAAFGLSDTRLRLAAIGGAWLLGRAYNYITEK